MRFSISHSKENNLELVILKDEKSKTEAAVLPTFGASLHAFNIIINDQLFNIINNYKSLEDAVKNLDTSYKSSKLSPFVCRIPKGKYKIGEKEFEFRKKFTDGSAIHGLLFNKPFEVIDEFANEDMASLILKYDYQKDDPGYPFDYRCEIRYMLRPDHLLKVETVVSNLDKTEIPVADGWHPYFRLGDNVNNCELRFQAANMVEFDDKLIPTGRLVSYDLFNEPKLINDTQLDNCFIPEQKDGGAVCEVFNPKNKLKILFFTDSSYPFLQIYTPGDRQSIAIENLSGAPNCFSNKMGLILLQPHQSKTFTVHYQARLV